jgi:hypothetical protein
MPNISLHLNKIYIITTIVKLTCFCRCVSLLRLKRMPTICSFKSLLSSPSPFISPTSVSGGCSPRISFPKTYRETSSNILYTLFMFTYCDGFAQDIAGQQPGGHIPAHAPCNNAVEVLSLCLRMNCCYTTHAQWHYTTVCRDYVTCAFCDARLCHGYITRFPEWPWGSWH